MHLLLQHEVPKLIYDYAVYFYNYLHIVRIFFLKEDLDDKDYKSDKTMSIVAVACDPVSIEWKVIKILILNKLQVLHC